MYLPSDDDTDTDTESHPDADEWPSVEERLKVLDADYVVVDLSTETAGTDTGRNTAGSLTVTEGAICRERELSLVSSGAGTLSLKSQSHTV